MGKAYQSAACGLLWITRKCNQGNLFAQTEEHVPLGSFENDLSEVSTVAAGNAVTLTAAVNAGTVTQGLVNSATRLRPTAQTFSLLGARN